MGGESDDSTCGASFCFVSHSSCHHSHLGLSFIIFQIAGDDNKPVVIPQLKDFSELGDGRQLVATIAFYHPNSFQMPGATVSHVWRLFSISDVKVGFCGDIR